MGVAGSGGGDQGRALVARSEIWWVEHPDAGRRPFLVLTRQAAIPVLNAFLSVPATRTIRQIPTEVVLDKGDGMPEECALSLDGLTLVPKELFRTRITRLSTERMSEVCKALALASGCS
ncbi:MAG: type II toxin-antitoxin system PemK/MazF family toxin [Gaiellaceae bacterium]